AILMAVALFAFLRLTDLGKAIRALAEEPEGAMLVGIDVARIRATAFGIGAACAAVAGALITPFFYVAPDVGESFNIMAFVVVVLILGLAVLIAVPPLLPKYFLDVLIGVLFTAYLGASWNILGGYAGQFSFGHAAFFGIGAYTSTLLLLQAGLTPWVGMLAGG